MALPTLDAAIEYFLGELRLVVLTIRETLLQMHDPEAALMTPERRSHWYVTQAGQRYIDDLNHELQVTSYYTWSSKLVHKGFDLRVFPQMTIQDGREMILLLPPGLGKQLIPLQVDRIHERTRARATPLIAVIASGRMQSIIVKMAGNYAMRSANPFLDELLREVLRWHPTPEDLLHDPWLNNLQPAWKQTPSPQAPHILTRYDEPTH